MNIRPQLGLLMVALAVVLNASVPQIDVMYERVEQINGTNFIDMRQLRVRKFNRTVAVLDGKFDLLRELNDRYEVETTAAYSTLGNNQFVHYPMKLASQKICEFFNTTWRDYQANFENDSNYPKIGECPIPAKQYYVKNHMAHSEVFPPFLPRGLWRFRVAIGQTGGENILAIANFYIKIEMKGIF